MLKLVLTGEKQWSLVTQKHDSKLINTAVNNLYLIFHPSRIETETRATPVVLPHTRMIC